MKIVKHLFIAGAISISLPSCFLFQPKHQSCPAYGEEIKKDNDSNFDLKNVTKEEETRKA